MLLELIRKEFMARKDAADKSVVSLLLSWIVRGLFVAGFVALECFIALSLDKKIEKYSSYGTYDFLVFFLFVVFVAGIFYTTVKARKAIFDRKDSQVILTLPVSSSDIILSKIIYAYLQEVLFQLIVASPLLICYGVRRDFAVIYYVFAILYPIFISLSAVGIALLFSVAYEFIHKLISKSDVAQFIIAAVLVIALCFVYRYALNLFLVALADSSVGGVFSPEFVEGVHTMSKGVIPVKNIIMMTILRSNLGPNIAIFVGTTVLALAAGIAVSSVSYAKMMRNGAESSQKPSKKTKNRKLVSPYKALVKKELSLLFRDGGNVFSYTSLLIMAPFLTYVVVSSLNGVIFEDLKFYATYFPELISAINLALILLFAGVINSSASMSMSREKRCVEVVKSIPVPIMKQLGAKLLIPMVFSEFSFMITLFVLWIASPVSNAVLLAALVIGTMMIVWNNAFGLYADMHDAGAHKSKLAPWASIIPIAMPLLVLAFHFAVTTYSSMPVWVVYVLETAFVAVCFLPFVIGYKKRYERSFREMEVRV